jgi:HEPN domain-containing protein
VIGKTSHLDLGEHERAVVEHDLERLYEPSAATGTQRSARLLLRGGLGFATIARPGKRSLSAVASSTNLLAYPHEVQNSTATDLRANGAALSPA